MSWIQNLIAKIAGKKAAQNAGLQEGTTMDKKQWWKSKTIWSDVLTIGIVAYNAAIPVLVKYGIVLPPIPQFLLAFFGGMGIYGRVSADTSIGSTPTPASSGNS